MRRPLFVITWLCLVVFVGGQAGAVAHGADGLATYTTTASHHYHGVTQLLPTAARGAELCKSGPALAAASIATSSGDPAPSTQDFVAAETAGAFGTDSSQALFWSGLGRNGATQASEYAAKTGGTTLEQTAGAAKLPAYDSSNAASVAAWRGASELFARGASGNVRVLLGNSGPDSIWNTVELPALKANSAVTSITAVDPATGSTSLIWAR